MLFNSFPFILVFLPAFLLLYYTAYRYNRNLILPVIVVSSLVFYSWWYPPNIVVILVSIGGNYLFANLLTSAERGEGINRLILAAALIFNIGLLGYYKYVNFIVDNFNTLSGLELSSHEVILPLAISFFTFQQIAFLIELYSKRIEKPGFVEYCAFITFFPQLIAGPIVRFKEIVPQFQRQVMGESLGSKRIYANLSIGLAIFIIGLAKKVIFADSLAEFSNPVFGAMAEGGSVTLFEAWIAAFAFAFQIYFDFSGYSDMAVGLARMAGYQLPVNFNSPFKMPNIRDFWQHWHITLTRFFTEYLYSPIALKLTRHSILNQYGKIRVFFAQVFIPVTLTFFLIGLWHGAGWNFVIFGLMHAAFLVFYHLWETAGKRYAPFRLFKQGGYLGHGAAILITFICVTLSLVMFRAESVPAAMEMFATMFGGYGVVLPEMIQAKLGGAATVLQSLGVEFGNSIYWQGTRQWIWLLMSATVVFMLPNTYELMSKYRPALGYVKLIGKHVRPTEEKFVWLSRGVILLTRVLVALLATLWVLSFFQELDEFRAVLSTGKSFLLSAVAFAALALLPGKRIGWHWRANYQSTSYLVVLALFSTIFLLIGNREVFIYFEF